MFHSALRPAPRVLRSVYPRLVSSSRRFASTAPTKKGTWKGTAARWGVAIGALYWYNTSPIFADEPLPQTVLAPPTFSEDNRQTVDAVIEEKRRKQLAVLSEEPVRVEEPAALDAEAGPAAASTTAVPEGGMGAVEEEAGQQGAFDPETGEINWDCPCLGGMAHGPCGEEFKAAFSCFVYSKEEPKGMDCIEKFQGMQECFRKYPEVYGAELAEDEAEEDAPGIEGNGQPPSDGEEQPAVARKASLEKDAPIPKEAAAREETPVPAVKPAASEVTSSKEKPSQTPNEDQAVQKPAVAATEKA